MEDKLAKIRDLLGSGGKGFGSDSNGKKHQQAKQLTVDRKTASPKVEAAQQ